MQVIKHAELESEEKLDKEKLNSEGPYWKHAIANQDYPRDANQDSRHLKDAWEDSIDVQEDAWEEAAKSVQDLNALITSTNLNAEEA